MKCFPSLVLSASEPEPAHRVARSPSGHEHAHRVARSLSCHEPAHLGARRSRGGCKTTAPVRKRRAEQCFWCTFSRMRASASGTASLTHVLLACLIQPPECRRGFSRCILRLLPLTPPSMLTKTAGHADKSSDFHEQVRVSVSVLGFSSRHWFSVSVLGLGSRSLVLGARRCISILCYRFPSFSSLCFPATDSHS